MINSKHTALYFTITDINIKEKANYLENCLKYVVTCMFTSKYNEEHRQLNILIENQETKANSTLVRSCSTIFCAMQQSRHLLV